LLGAPLRKGRLYKHVVKWIVEDGFCQEEEFYAIAVGYLTREAILEIKTHQERPFIQNSANVMQIAKRGLKIRTPCSRKYFNQSNQQVSFAVKNPSKGDEFILRWKWRKNNRICVA
jgi:hypothetical protein